MSYLITRNDKNGREYYLENIYDNDRVLWITDKSRALSFADEAKLHQFINREFPHREYYATTYRAENDWGPIAKPKGLGFR